MNRSAAARKIQKIFRKKRSANTGLGFKLSKPSVVSMVSTLKIPIMIGNVFLHAPIGFSEVAGYINFRKKPRVRYVKGSGWVGDGFEHVKYITAKYGNTTVIIQADQIRVSGPGTYEQMYRLCIKNKWILPLAMRLKPVINTINCKFRVNKTIDLPIMRNYIIHQIPEGMLESKPGPILPEVRTPALSVKFKKPKFTYQFFKNGTILFSGIKKLSDIDVPPELFKQFFSRYGFDASDVFGAAPNRPGANRYPSAGTWNSLVSPVPRGYYIRPGPNGQPRLYPYQYYTKLTAGPNILNSVVNLGPLATKVRKAFEAVGKPIPESTLKIFREAGAPLRAPPPNKVVYTGPANRRASNWNATRNGYYVRPGPGQQPYWYAVPKGVAAGRKTVIAAYSKAGRNIPKAVREIFKISENVKINNTKKAHEFMMGSNGILRINGKQATRLTKKELLAIARNANIAEVGNKMKPVNIIAHLKRKTAAKGVGAFNLTIGTTKYKLLENARVRRLKLGKAVTTREWTTMKPSERNAIIKSYIKKDNRANFVKRTLADQYSVLYQKSRNGHVAASASPGSSVSTPNLGNVFANENNVRNENFA